MLSTVMAAVYAAAHAGALNLRAADHDLSTYQPPVFEEQTSFYSSHSTSPREDTERPTSV